MHLYFLRHGLAEEPRAGLADADRHLTPEGVDKMGQEAAGMRVLGLRFDAAFTSPYHRAAETAQIVRDALELPSLIEIPALASGAFRVGALQDTLIGVQPDAHVLFVGHEPDMSMLVGLLTGAQVEMKKGGLACIETGRPEPGVGVLRWLLPPRILIALGSAAQ